MTDSVRAAGGVVRRWSGEGVEKVLLVHRPAYDDWTFPKGKLEEGESEEDAAVREVEEETGLHCSLGREIATTRYRDSRGRRKTVRYWQMTPVSGELAPAAGEVDEARFVPLAQARVLLSYTRDVELLDGLGEGVTTVHLVRHAKAKDRGGWAQPDELRPLTKRGHREAEAIAARLRGERVTRLVSSPFARTVQTLEPLAVALDLPIETTELLAEGAGAAAANLLLSFRGASTVVCSSHGDVVDAVLRAVEASGVGVEAHDARLASTWVLEVEDDSFVGARFVEPPLGG